ncbi:uncharacterized protein VP01_927g3 [Puccinia sorghi]|uniref:Uncharacterized protein n=1 Tax=Puccinia sorghi TaxID=27349 RepID=A0A0L6U738_9BASI|nr:uncharacterized protein VP01_927g3 [Puccinia sorghi]
MRLTPQLAQDTSAATPENQYDVVDCSNASGDPGVSPDDSPSVSSPAATPAEVADPDASTTADENADQQLSITAAPVGPEDCVALDSLDFTPAEERASTEKSSDAQDATVEAPAVPQQSSTPTANQPAEAAPPTAEELTTEGASPAHPIAEKVNDPPSQPEASATVSESVPVNDDNAPSPRTEVPTDSTEGKDVANAPEQVPVPTADTTPAGPASEEVPTSEPVGVDTAEPVTPQLDVPPATEPSTMASSAEAKSDLKSGKHADSDANSIQEPLEKTIVDNNSALPSKSAMSSYLRAFLDSPPPSSTSVPKPPVDQATTAKVWPGAPAVSNVKREILLPARMKKLSMASTSSRHSLFVKDLAAFSFPSFIPATPKPTLNDSTSPVISTTGPSTPVPCVSPLQNLDASPSSPTKAKPMNYRRSKLVKLSPSLKRARVVDSVDHRAWRSSYRSATLRNKNAPPVIDGASMVQRTRSHKLLEFGIRPHSPKKRSTRMEQNNDLSDAFAIIQLSDATTYNPRADRYVNPTLGRRLSTSVKDIVLKRQNRDLLKKAPLDDVYVAEGEFFSCLPMNSIEYSDTSHCADFHFDLDKELANLPESFSEDDFEPVELGTAGPSGSSQRESRIHEESNFRRSVDSKPSTKESVLSNDPKGKKHHRIRSKLAGATISLSDKTARF